MTDLSFQATDFFSHTYQTLTLSQTSPGVYVSAVQVFRKHCGKRINGVFYRFGELSAIFIKFEIVVCKLFKISVKFIVWERVKGKNSLEKVCLNPLPDDKI